MEAPKPVLLLDRVRNAIRRKHYSLRTEQAYCDWIKRFVIFHGKRHPSELGAAEVEAFLTSLAVRSQVAAATQNQAKAALLFLYKEVLDAELPWLGAIVQAKVPTRLPVVLTRAEVDQVLARLNGVHRLIGALLYGTGLRIMEAMRLRVKDVEFARGEIVVRDGKGQKDRITMLPVRIAGPLRDQLSHTRELHRVDIAEGFGETWLPFALSRKYSGAAREWAWQYVFPAEHRSLDPRDRVIRRHHLSARHSSGR
jgi:integron integrase